MLLPFGAESQIQLAHSVQPKCLKSYKQLAKKMQSNAGHLNSWLLQSMVCIYSHCENNGFAIQAIWGIF
jgi:hypothetical protein